jgi:ATP-binding cassette subfamily B protein RaxB
MASVADEISAMPMGFETLCGDMGSTLSGGQKARILLARALYKQPKVLFVDEGTAHLDIETERAVNEAVRLIGVSRLLIAHRPETLRLADRIVRLENGRITD